MPALLRQPRPFRDRLQLAAFAMVVLVVAVAAAMQFGGASPFQHLFGDDFVPSYMAGTFVREGRTDLLTDYAAAERFQRDLREQAGLEQHGRTGPWLNPPFYAAVFVPLSALPYRAALWTWFGLNIVMLSASVLLLYRMLPAEHRRRRDGLIIAALVAASMPALQAMACQQNTFLSLLILCGAMTLARADKPFAAGAVAALLLFKPQLAVIVCGAVACTVGWRAIAGMAVTAAALLLATFAFMPGAIADYLHKLPSLLPYLRTDRPYPWERQMTFLGFWRLLLGGRTGGPNPGMVTALWLVGAAAVAGVLFGPLWKAFRGVSNSAVRDRLLAATIAASPLLMPYYMDYDLLLLAVPAVLLAAERMQTGKLPGDRLLIAAWVAIYGWLYINAAVADATGISLIVLLMVIRFAMPVRSIFEPAAVAGAAAPDSKLRVPQVAGTPETCAAPREHRSADCGRPVAPGATFVVLPLFAAVLAMLLAVAAGLLDKSSPLTFGHDLLPSYAAGRLVIEGRAADLYDASATRALGRSIVADQNLTNDPEHVLWLNPPAFALVFAPLSAMPYRVALLVWLGLNAALATTALRTILGWIASRRRSFWVGVAVLTSCPFVLAVEHQQNTFLSLAIVTAAVVAWRADRALLAGILVGLLACKPQLAFAAGVVLMVCEGRRAIGGLAIGGLAILLAGEAIAPGSTLAFLKMVPNHAAFFQQHPGYNWGRQMTPTSMLQSLLGPMSPAAKFAGHAVSLACVAAVAWVARRCVRAMASSAGLEMIARKDRAIALAILAMPLCTPYFMDYDLLLLVVPFALLLNDDRLRRPVLRFGLTLWPTLYLTVDIVAATGVNPVPLLLAVASVWLATRLTVTTAAETTPLLGTPSSSSAL